MSKRIADELREWAKHDTSPSTLYRRGGNEDGRCLLIEAADIIEELENKVTSYPCEHEDRCLSCGEPNKWPDGDSGQLTCACRVTAIDRQEGEQHE